MTYIDPNSIMTEGSVTFVYTKSGNLYHALFPSAHASLLANDEIWNDVVSENSQPMNLNTKEIYQKAMKRRGVSEKIAILGRVQSSQRLRDYVLDKIEGNPPNVISIWNEDSQLVKQLLPSCLKNLINKNICTPSDVVLCPHMNATTVEELIGGRHQKSGTTDDVGLMKQLHLLPSPEKRKAMKQLGLSGGQKNAWQAALEKGGHINPGQKYWAPHSECRSFKQWLEEEQVDEGLFKKKLSTAGGSVGPVTRKDRVKKKWAEIEKQGKEEDAANKKSLEKPFRRRYQNAK